MLPNVKYMKKFLNAFFMTIAAMTFAACANQDDYDVYLLIGQSNMAGRGTMLAEDTLNVIEGVWLLDPDGIPEPAKAPLNKYSTIRKNLGMQQIGPGNSFAEEIHKATGRKILLVVNARGGSALEVWMPGNTASGYFDAAVKRTRQAMQHGDLKAIIWHQGESSSGRSETYPDSLSVFVSALRQEFGDDDIPFVAGEVGHWTDHAEEFNSMISHISERIPCSDYVSSEGCSMLKDESDPHFSRDGQILLGKRYAHKVLEMISAAPSVRD